LHSFVNHAEGGSYAISTVGAHKAEAAFGRKPTVAKWPNPACNAQDSILAYVKNPRIVTVVGSDSPETAAASLQGMWECA
jgi:hypothetical protein